jgi:hypothetical protein
MPLSVRCLRADNAGGECTVTSRQINAGISANERHNRLSVGGEKCQSGFKQDRAQIGRARCALQQAGSGMIGDFGSPRTVRHDAVRRRRPSDEIAN